MSNEVLPALLAESVTKAAWKKEALVNKVRIKKPPPKHKQDSDHGNGISPGSPLVNYLEGALRSTFESGKTFDDRLNPIQCKHCKKPLLLEFANAHINMCITKKNEKAQRKKEQKEANRKAREAQQKAERAGEDAADAEGEDDSVNGDSRIGKKSAIKGSAGTSKKRKADDEADGSFSKKKTKKELEAMKPKIKTKGPVDVEKQCGVMMQNGQQCARSLTCKSHSMGLKRAVPGRSMPYNLLLAAYNKKNQAKQQKAAMDATALPADDYGENNGPVDSDEEKDLVMAGIARSRPQPIAQHCMMSMRRKYQFVRVRDMIRSALGTGKSAMGSSAIIDGDELDNPRVNFGQSSGRPSMSAGMGGPSRKQSLVTPGTPIVAN